jgi:hypothetical protein
MLVIDAFNKLDIPYLIGGSLASAIHGTARSTLDTDLVADLRNEQIHSLIEVLHPDFYIDEEMIRDAIQHQSSFNLIHLDSTYKVDIFILKPRHFDRMQFQRRRFQVVADDPEVKAYVSTAEDIILAKLEWYRMGGEASDRQWRDILGVIKIQAGRLDQGYLQQMADELNVNDLFQRALKEAE